MYILLLLLLKQCFQATENVALTRMRYTAFLSNTDCRYAWEFKGSTFYFQIVIELLVSISQSLQFLQSSPGLARLALLPQHIGRVGQRQDIAGSLLHLTCCHSFRFRHVTQHPLQEGDEVLGVSGVLEVFVRTLLFFSLNFPQSSAEAV